MAATVRDCIVLLGDSLTEGGWQPGGIAQRLAEVYSRKLDVVCRGLSGYNTEWALPVVGTYLANQHEQQHVPKIRLVTIWYGANDSVAPWSAQHIPLPAFSQNLQKLIHLLTSPSSPSYSPNTHIVLITPPPVHEKQLEECMKTWDPPAVLDREFDVTKAYADAVREVGKVEGVQVVDAWTDIWNKAGNDMEALRPFLSDGLHLTAAGYHVVHEGLIKVIAEKFPELQHEQMALVSKEWREWIPQSAL